MKFHTTFREAAAIQVIEERRWTLLSNDHFAVTAVEPAGENGRATVHIFFK